MGVGALGYVSVTSGWGLYALGRRQARREAQPTAEQAMAADDRPPVLWLRAFDRDEIGSPAIWGAARYRSFEERLLSFSRTAERDHWTNQAQVSDAPLFGLSVGEAISIPASWSASMVRARSSRRFWISFLSSVRSPATA